MTEAKPTDKRPKRGVLLRVQNGDVIGFDETGVRLNLADSVIANIKQRLEIEPANEEVDPSVLGDINAWDLRVNGDWYLFSAHLPGAQNIGPFRRRVHADGDAIPHIIANPSVALYGLFSLGGARRGTTMDLPIEFPFHLLSTGDDMGAAGPAGTQGVAQTDLIERLNEQTQDSLAGDEIITRRMAAYRALPVLYVRGETDSSTSINALLTGAAFANFTQTIANFCAAARSLKVPAKVLAVTLDFALEAVEDDADSWLLGMYSAMQRITDVFADHGLRKPLFIAPFDAGTQVIADHPVLRAQWQLAWNKGGHDHVYSAPSYMFALDTFGRATPEARLQIAEMDACAIEALNSDRDWACPLFLLAERETDARIIRCRAQAMTPLVLDADDPLKAGSACGFSLEGCENGASIIDVSLDPNDPQDVLITCDIAPSGEKLHLLYAVGAAASSDGMPANRGALRDEWAQRSKTGAMLHRWALPAALPVH